MKGKLNIAHVSTYLQGGAGRIIVSLIGRQIKQGNNVICILNRKAYPGYTNYKHYLEQLERIGCRVYMLDSLFKRNEKIYPTAAEDMACIIKEHKIDIAHCHASVPAHIASLARVRAGLSFPIIQTMHGWGENKTPEQERFDVEVMNNIEAVVAVSDSSRLLLERKGVGPSNITVIYNGVSEVIRVPDCLDSEIEEFWGAAALKVLCIGTVCERKNQRLLVDAVISIRDSTDEIKVVFAGDDNSDYAVELKSDIKFDEQFKFVGISDETPALMKEADLVVLPSLSEGLPITVIESFRDGVLVLASDIAENCELVENAKNGLTFFSSSLSDLSSMLLKVLNMSDNEKEILINSALKDYRDSFSIEKMSESYDRLYERFILSGTFG